MVDEVLNIIGDILNIGSVLTGLLDDRLVNRLAVKVQSYWITEISKKVGNMSSFIT